MINIGHKCRTTFQTSFDSRSVYSWLTVRFHPAYTNHKEAPAQDPETSFASPTTSNPDQGKIYTSELS